VIFWNIVGTDKETRVIAGYLEGIKNGRRFYELAQKISKQKPIIIWKGGLTESGAGLLLRIRIAGRFAAGLGTCSNSRELSASTAWKKRRIA